LGLSVQGIRKKIAQCRALRYRRRYRVMNLFG
jgi:hypothetical protein